jgi:hypothetical protein
MSRMIKLLAPLSLAAALAGATFAACGARPGSPGEMPPVAPRPAPADPSGAPGPGSPGGMPNPEVGSGALGPTNPHGNDAGSAAPGPISVRTLPTPTLSAEAYGNVSNNQPPPRDAAVGDSYAPPLPPIPDGGVPLDSRVEPRVEPRDPAWPPADPQWPSFPH